ncbi:hypothetical protein LPJ53_005702 [Coemansia erecta]|uniref:FAD/NAD(P)-binding domain-containing protein n=1 Tax=Coemansia erecta TaxID=147472 RepID=A0A9W8CPI7_9FUNG|nr:hypothetical protein LPJ53_005702 [Coemansia erecta]
MAPIRIVVAGCNYAGINALKTLYSTLLAKQATAATAATAQLPDVHITAIDRRDGFVHYIGITRGITEPEFGEQLWVPFKQVGWMQHPKITFRQGTVAKITSTHVVIEGSEQPIEFDYLVVALGVGRYAPIGVGVPTKPEFIEQLSSANKRIQAAGSVAVVGGGAVGIEMAADIKCDFPEKQVTLIHSRELPLPGPFKDQFRESVVEILKDKIGVSVVLGERVVSQAPVSDDMRPTHACDPEFADSSAINAQMTLSSGRSVSADYVIRCLGTCAKFQNLICIPNCNIFDASGIRVRDTMQIDSSDYPNIYACGDICSRDQVKLAGVAMYGGYIAARNIARSVIYGDKAVLEKGELYPSKIMLLMGKDHFALQIGDEIWDTERARPYATPDMGLDNCIKALSLDCTPEFEHL